jgi:hypothetical protein
MADPSSREGLRAVVCLNGYDHENNYLRRLVELRFHFRNNGERRSVLLTKYHSGD